MNNKINKTAYPQGHSDYLGESYDVNKWIKTFQTISLYARQGYDLRKVSEQLTQDWDKMEKSDFYHWMKYYQGGSHNAYKTAQFAPSPATQYIEMGPGALLPNKPTDLSNTDDLKPKIKMPEEDDPQFKINKKIKSIINRLMAAEKLATDPEVQRELSKRLDISLHKWLEELQRVKRLVQIAPIKHAQSSILEDLIVKEANILAFKGFPKTAHELIKIAQAAPSTDAKAPLTPSGPGSAATSPPSDSGTPPTTPPTTPPLPGPMPGPLPGPPGSMPMPPGAPNAPNAPESSKKQGEEAIKEFIDLMNPNNKKDKNEIVDMIDEDPLAAITVMDDDDGFAYDSDDDLYSFAQEMPASEALPSDAASMAPPSAVEPAMAPQAQIQPKPKAQPEIEVSEEPEQFAETKVHKKTDDLLEQALSNITVNDVIERLDTLVNLFRTREIPRQLAIIDLMMDQLNLSSFFPGLAEASSKSLESNQYALSRIEEVLSKLKGSIKNPKHTEIDLMGFQSSPTPTGDIETDNVRANLENQDQRERNRRRQKKEEELNKYQPAEELEVSEDLFQPVNLEGQPPVSPPVAPRQPPPVAPRQPPAVMPINR